MENLEIVALRSWLLPLLSIVFCYDGGERGWSSMEGVSEWRW